jgi:hypothetical protein
LGRSSSRYEERSRRAFKRWLPIEARVFADALPNKMASPAAAHVSPDKLQQHKSCVSTPITAESCRDWTMAIKEVPSGLAEVSHVWPRLLPICLKMLSCLVLGKRKTSSRPPNRWRFRLCLVLLRPSWTRQWRFLRCGTLKLKLGRLWGLKLMKDRLCT